MSKGVCGRPIDASLSETHTHTHTIQPLLDPLKLGTVVVARSLLFSTGRFLSKGSGGCVCLRPLFFFFFFFFFFFPEKEEGGHAAWICAGAKLEALYARHVCAPRPPTAVPTAAADEEWQDVAIETIRKLARGPRRKTEADSFEEEDRNLEGLRERERESFALAWRLFLGKY